MTVVVADVEDGLGYMASDSQTTAGSRRIIREKSKIDMISVDVGGEEYALVGHAGRVRDAQVAVNKMRTLIRKNILKIKSSPTTDTILNTVVEPVRDELDDKGSREKRRGRERSRTRLLLVIEGIIFEIGMDYSIMKYDEGPVTIGSGGAVARGVLYSDDGSDVKSRLVKSIEGACEHDVYCQKPIHFTSTDGTEEILRGKKK